MTGLLSCDDGTLQEDGAFMDFSNKIGQASEKFGTPISDPTRWKKRLEDRGFQNVTEVIKKLPTSPWARDTRMKLLGAWEMENLLMGLQGMVTRLFQAAFGWSQEQIEVYLIALRKDIQNLRQHAYWP